MLPVNQLDLDEATLLGDRAQLAFYAAYRGTIDHATLDQIREAIEALDDRDLYSGTHDLAGYVGARGGPLGRCDRGLAQGR